MSVLIVTCACTGVSLNSPPLTAPANGTSMSAVSPYNITYPPMPTGLEPVRVTRVIDGDTFDVQSGTETVRVRLIGMNTPESVDPRRAVQCFGKEASDRARTLLLNQTVLLEIDPASDTVDQYGRILRFAWLADGRLFNLQMIAEGYASEYTYQGTRYKYQSEFKLAQRVASGEARGLWSAATCAGDFNRGVPAR